MVVAGLIVQLALMLLLRVIGVLIVESLVVRLVSLVLLCRCSVRHAYLVFSCFSHRTFVLYPVLLRLQRVLVSAWWILFATIFSIMVTAMRFVRWGCGLRPLLYLLEESLILINHARTVLRVVLVVLVIPNVLSVPTLQY